MQIQRQHNCVHPLEQSTRCNLSTYSTPGRGGTPYSKVVRMSGPKIREATLRREKFAQNVDPYVGKISIEVHLFDMISMKW